MAIFQNGPWLNCTIAGGLGRSLVAGGNDIRARKPSYRSIFSR